MILFRNDKKLMITDPIFGIIKYCVGCDEYYPMDREFFFKNGHHPKSGKEYFTTLCKSCFKSKYRPGKGIYKLKN